MLILSQKLQGGNYKMELIEILQNLLVYLYGGLAFVLIASYLIYKLTKKEKALKKAAVQNSYNNSVQQRNYEGVEYKPQYKTNSGKVSMRKPAYVDPEIAARRKYEREFEKEMKRIEREEEIARFENLMNKPNYKIVKPVHSKAVSFDDTYSFEDGLRIYQRAS